MCEKNTYLVPASIAETLSCVSRIMWNATICLNKDGSYGKASAITMMQTLVPDTLMLISSGTLLHGGCLRINTEIHSEGWLLTSRGSMQVYPMSSLTSWRPSGSESAMSLPPPFSRESKQGSYSINTISYSQQKISGSPKKNTGEEWQL